MSSLTPDHAYFFVVDGYELDRKNIQDVTVVKGSDHFRSFGFPFIGLLRERNVCREAYLCKGHFFAFSWSLNKERIKTQVKRFLSFSQQIQRTIKKECML